MNKQIFTEKDIKYKKILKSITRRALKLTGGTEALVAYGTNSTLKKHLPKKNWDRAHLYIGLTGRGIHTAFVRLKAIVSLIKGIFPIKFYSFIEDRKVEHSGIISFMFNRHDYIYKKGITVLFVPEIRKYITNSKDDFMTIPVFAYDGYKITQFTEKLKVDIRIIRVARSKNFISFLIPQFGLMELNNCDPELYLPENEEIFKKKLNQLITYVNNASMTYYHQKGKYISETQRLEDLVEKEEMLRELGAVLRNREEELLHNIMILDKVTKEKYELEMQRDQLSEEVIKSQQVITEIGEETDANLATIAHTTKNLYMAQKSFTNFVNEDVQIIQNNMVELEKYLQKVTAQYPKLNKYPFWKIICNTFKNIKMTQSGLAYNGRRSTEHMAQIMEYILSVLAYQRGREYVAEGKYYSDLIKTLKYIMNTHHRRLEELGIDFRYDNKSGDPKVLINNIYHFHLEKDIFINLLLNSIQAFPDRPNKKIWIEIYSESAGSGNQYYEIHYRDNGVGIPEDKKQAIFSGWSSKDTAGTTSLDDKTEHGVGGKTIYKRIKNARGSIKEIGIPGQGAHFVIKLEKFSEEGEEGFDLGEELYIEPIQSGIATVSGMDSEEVINTVAGKNILIVDDDEKIQNYIANIFKDALIPSFASGHEDAWNNIYSTSPPDIITLDLDLLSTEKGENLLFDLNMRGISRKIPIVVVSGADRVYEVDKLTKLGAAAVFHKPVKEQELRKVVFELLTGKFVKTN